MIVSKYPAVEPTTDKTEKYWMSWSNSTVKVGKGDVVGEGQFMSAVDPESRKVNYIVIASQGADTQWTFKIPGEEQFLFACRLKSTASFAMPSVVNQSDTFLVILYTIYSHYTCSHINEIFSICIALQTQTKKTTFKFCERDEYPLRNHLTI